MWRPSGPVLLERRSLCRRGRSLLVARSDVAGLVLLSVSGFHIPLVLVLFFFSFVLCSLFFFFIYLFFFGGGISKKSVRNS